jgi:hypothetical protein
MGEIRADTTAQSDERDDAHATSYPPPPPPALAAVAAATLCSSEWVVVVVVVVLLALGTRSKIITRSLLGDVMEAVDGWRGRSRASSVVPLPLGDDSVFCF